jgi:hypothetical protein
MVNIEIVASTHTYTEREIACTAARALYALDHLTLA